MDERDGFLRAIHDEPDDDVHRLVFADWLEDHDEPEWAALIRHQCGLARLVERGTDPFKDAGSLEVSILKPTLRDSILRCLAPLPKLFTSRRKRQSRQSRRNRYVLFVQKGLPEHLRLVENDALRGLLVTLQATQGNWARSLRLLSFGQPQNHFGFHSSYPSPSPSYTMVGQFSRSGFLLNFSDIDMRNYILDEDPNNVLPRPWPVTTRLWVNGYGVGPMSNLDRLQSLLGSCLVVDPEHPGDRALLDDIPF